MLGWDINRACSHIEFLIFDLSDAIARLDSFLMSLPASKTPTWVGLGGEEADTDGFGPQKFRWNASYNQISWTRAGISNVPMSP